MGGGILQLVMTGEMDTKWLTGNPQISFFKQVYKFNTLFSRAMIRFSAYYYIFFI